METVIESVTFTKNKKKKYKMINWTSQYESRTFQNEEKEEKMKEEMKKDSGEIETKRRVNMWTDLSPHSVVTEDGYDAGLLYGGSVEVQADETIELSERLKVLRFEQVTVSEAEVCEGRVGSCQRGQHSPGSDVTVVKTESGEAGGHGGEEC